MNRQMSFSIVIPSRTWSNLEPCINAVRAAGQNERIILVDDGVEWDTRDVNGAPSKFGPRDIPNYFEQKLGISVVPGVKPFVFARNCNIGIRAAGDDDVILLNDDALLQDQHGFTRLERACTVDHSVGIIGATTNITGQPLQWRKEVGLRLARHFAFVCVYIPRRTIERVGLLDERYCLDYGVEDRDYCEAVNRAGMTCAVHDFCFVDHGSLVSSFRGDPKTPKGFSQNLKLFQQKWGIA